MEIGLFEMRVTKELKLSSSCLLIEINTMTSVKDNNIIFYFKNDDTCRQRKLT